MESNENSPKVVKVSLPNTPRTKNTNHQNIKSRYLQYRQEANRKKQFLTEENSPQGGQVIQKHQNTINGDGYTIVWNQNRKGDQSDPKIQYFDLNVAILLFELAGQNFETQTIVRRSLTTIEARVQKQLTKKYGRNIYSQKKLRSFLYLLTTLFYRKESLTLSELVFYLFDCSIIESVRQFLNELYPTHISKI